MPSNDQVAELIAALRLRFAPRWHIAVPGIYLRMHYRETATTVRPPRRQMSPAHLVNAIGGRFAEAGVPRSSLLPIRCGRDTDLTISAIQGLDPWLKDGAGRVWREGYLAQPVVRFNGERDDQGRLREGFLTAFVNVSSVTRIGSVERHVGLLDAWIGALSAIGIHASRLTIHGDVEVWQRGPVSGITLFCDCDDKAVSDAVLLWRTADPSRMASDIGSGLERLRWLLSSCSWAETTFGPVARYCSVDVLDAVRAALSS